MMFCTESSVNIVLASASPRRRELLQQIGISFTVYAVNIQESPSSTENLEDYVLRLAESKGRESSKRFPSHWIISADTDVAIDGRILGKPKDKEEAYDFLKNLSDRWHRVMTGLSIIKRDDNFYWSQVVSSEVKFIRLTDELIQAYLHTEEWKGKAGGYAIQGIASCFVRKIEGSITNVIGLPLDVIVLKLLELKLIQPLTCGQQ